MDLLFGSAQGSGYMAEMEERVSWRSPTPGANEAVADVHGQELGPQRGYDSLRSQTPGRIQ